ncbi:hypothetical protein N7468_008441 [Penicillium chermesinum]|uniref:N-acetyltransferase domain-containing protein n=1 Tax=Penicillium chermesinum TaxID=63820 RepID=A0A9W9NSL4_9EURO|nr:uncharacterized protein N7468_008441 [Penicillium chermesinum]KAJ5223899.1 hypothetical protein N7468_008441 [Penicillium chermesinum]KAJ6155276.1 hypothetical protein N7470_005842 [Penicillium chermesinum]
MAYSVEYVTEPDAPALGEINNIAFSNRLVLPLMFPEASEASLNAYKAKHVMKHLANPEVHVLKASDATGKILAYGRWHIPAKLGVAPVVPPLSEQAQAYASDPVRFAPQPMREDVFTAFKALLEGARKRHTTERDITLDMLATLPAYQGRGVGSAVLRWGMAQADALKARIYLEATAEGFPLYEKNGWKPVEELTMDFKPLGLEGEDKFWVMIRDPVPT